MGKGNGNPTYGEALFIHPVANHSQAIEFFNYGNIFCRNHAPPNPIRDYCFVFNTMFFAVALDCKEFAQFNHFAFGY